MGRSHERPFSSSRDRKPASQRSPWKNHFVAASSEFVGTFMFLYFAFAGHQTAANTATDKGPDGVNSSQTIIYIALSYGMSLLVIAWSLYRVSGGLFNPA